MSRHRNLRLSSCAAVCLGLSCLAQAQSPSAWSVLPVPGGVVSTAIRQIGKIITYTENTQVHAYSAFSHRWVAQPTSSAAAVRVGNDLALAVDSSTYHGFSAYTGAWSSVTLSPNAALVNPTNQQNDAIWLVLDGLDLWAFTAYRGTWVRLVVGAGASVQTERHVAMVIDGTTLHGLSALNGAWVATTALAPPTLSRARGTAAVAGSSAGLQGFSAMSNTWSTAPAPGPAPVLTVADDVQLIDDAGNYVAFSGLLGAFASIALPAVTVTLGETLCFATDGATQHWAYSAVRGRWTVLPTATLSGGAVVGSNAILLLRSDRVDAFSAMTGTVATASVAPSVTTLSRSVAALIAQDSSVKFYSAVLGQWFDAPVGGTASEISDVAGFVRTPTGISGFSSRTGQFTPLAVAPTATTKIAIGNAVQAVVDNSVLYVFDPRRGRWLSSPLQGTPTFGIHRTTLMAVDGTQAYGYGSYTGRLTQITLPAVSSILRPNSESCSLEVQNAIYAHSSVPDILTLWQYPEFRRVYVTGTPMEVQVQASNGTGFVFLGLRVLMNPVPFIGLGDLELDPAGLVLLSGLPVTINQGHGVLSFPVPRLRMLQGIELGFQGVIVSTVGLPYLTQSTSVSMF